MGVSKDVGRPVGPRAVHAPGGDRGVPRARRVCVVSTVPFAVRAYMAPHIIALCGDCEVTIVASGGSDEVRELLGERVRFVSVEIERKIRIARDVRALVNLWRLFRREKFDAVHSIMPKSGMLSMLAARAAGIRIRVHTFTGQVWVTRKRFAAGLLKACDRLLAVNATHLLTDGHTQLELLVKNRIVPRAKIHVLADGSFAGVNLKRFAFDSEARNATRDERAIPVNAVVFMYVGRLNRDKGIADLFHAFAEVAEHDRRAHLFIVGPDEDGATAGMAELSRRFPSRVHRAEYTRAPERYLSAADVLCLPSYREGFPNVPLQAAAAGVPTLGSAINGITDAVEDGVTGILHPTHAPHEIAQRMRTLLNDARLRHRLGEAARARVTALFPEARLTGAFAEYYRQIFRECCSGRAEGR